MAFNTTGQRARDSRDTNSIGAHLSMRLERFRDFDWCEAGQITDLSMFDDGTYSEDVNELFAEPRALSALAFSSAESAAVGQQLEEQLNATSPYEHPTWLQKCTSIYLDLGSNIGAKPRKLFEPEKYPWARLLIFLTLLQQELESSSAERRQEKLRAAVQQEEAAKKAKEDDERDQLKSERLNLLVSDQSVAAISSEGPLGSVKAGNALLKDFVKPAWKCRYAFRPFE